MGIFVQQKRAHTFSFWLMVALVCIQCSEYYEDVLCYVRRRDALKLLAGG